VSATDALTRDLCQVARLRAHELAGGLLAAVLGAETWSPSAAVLVDAAATLINKCPAGTSRASWFAVSSVR
jgi:hypothetical protein